MRDLPTTVCLVILTVLSAVATGLAFAQLRAAGRNPRRQRQQDLLVLTIAVGSAAVFFYRWWVLRQTLEPLQSHVDGLLLMSALLAATVLYLEGRSRLPGLAAFALPLLTLMEAWSICASRWTYEPFEVHSAWKTLHLAGVYVGTIFLALGAVSGGMYLFAQHKLRDKRDLSGLSRLASLETIERAIIHATAVGFALLTLGLLAGLVVVSGGPTDLGPGWWHSPKVVLAVAAWLVYALVLNVRHATLFRGARAAWLSIFGIVLLLATFGVVSSIDLHRPPEAPTPGTPGAPDHPAPTRVPARRDAANRETPRTPSPKSQIPNPKSPIPPAPEAP